MRTLFTAERLGCSYCFVRTQLSFPAKTDEPNLALLLHVYAEHYCLVPHPMAVLGRK
jgi:hypothetical protein